jgi:TonB family protein
MIKTFLTLILGLILLQTAHAEKTDSVIYYLKKSGKQVLIKDSADFFRVILPPDTAADKDLYRVYDFYSTGKKKRVATSLNADFYLRLDGTCIEYFPNGKRKSISQYKNGRLVGTITSYYPNGNLYYNFDVEDISYGYYDYYSNYRGYFARPGNGYKLHVTEFRDSTGTLLASNGTGHVLLYDDDFKKVLEEGNLNHDKRDGEWTGRIADSVKADSGIFKCVFHKDVLKSGITYMKSGRQYTFKQVNVDPVFSDGMPAFFLFIKKNVQYPESAKKRKIVGSVSVGFIVQPDGSVSDVKVLQGLFKSCDDEAVRVISMSPLWVPGYKFGVPVPINCRVSVGFSPY